MIELARRTPLFVSILSLLPVSYLSPAPWADTCSHFGGGNGSLLLHLLPQIASCRKVAELDLVQMVLAQVALQSLSQQSLSHQSDCLSTCSALSLDSSQDVKGKSSSASFFHQDLRLDSLPLLSCCSRRLHTPTGEFVMGGSSSIEFWTPRISAPEIDALRHNTPLPEGSGLV